MTRRRVHGFSLVELIVAIVIISVAVGGVLMVFTVAITYSADPQLSEQEVAIAQGYLDEILARSYSPRPGSGSRPSFDDVDDYDGLSEEPTDQDGNALADLDEYHVDVSVSAEGDFGPAGATVKGKRIDVSVTRPPSTDPLTLSGIKTAD